MRRVRRSISNNERREKSIVCMGASCSFPSIPIHPPPPCGKTGERAASHHRRSHLHEGVSGISAIRVFSCSCNPICTGKHKHAPSLALALSTLPHSHPFFSRGSGCHYAFCPFPLQRHTHTHTFTLTLTLSARAHLHTYAFAVPSYNKRHEKGTNRISNTVGTHPATHPGDVSPLKSKQRRCESDEDWRMVQIKQEQETANSRRRKRCGGRSGWKVRKRMRHQRDIGQHRERKQLHRRVVRRRGSGRGPLF